MNKLKTGIIGAGNMGGAIASGIANGIGGENVFIYDSDHQKSHGLSKSSGIKSAETFDAAADNSDILIIAVKPDKVDQILAKLTNYRGIIISIAAGVTIEKLKITAGVKSRIIRAMPNTPALCGAGMTVLSPDDNITEEELETVSDILSHTGKVLILPEKLMDAVTGVSGSGPAYVFTFIQAIADGAVKMGIPRKEALILAGQTVFGSAKMFLDISENPIKLRDNVTSPGGTTIEAVHILEKAGFSGIIMDAVEAASNKSRELGKI